MRKQPFSRQSEEKRDFVLKIAIVDDLSSVWVQYLALPCFGVLFKLIVDAESGMILFLYLFIIDYLLVVRAAAFYISQALSRYNFFSWETACSGSENPPPFIRLSAVQTGISPLSITTDNTSAFSPTWMNEKLVSTKPAGSGIGTESIRMIAEQYHGDARFEWRDGVFYASVLLNPDRSSSLFPTTANIGVQIKSTNRNPINSRIYCS